MDFHQHLRHFLCFMTVGTCAGAAILEATPSEAATLSGSVSLSGDVEFSSTVINPNVDSLTFVNGEVEEASGDLASLLNTNPVVASLGLTLLRILDSNNADFTTSAEYSFGAVPDFIDFGAFTLDGVTSNLIFNLDAGTITRNRRISGSLLSVGVGVAPIQGMFQFDGQNFAIGFLGATLAGESDTFTISLETAEPTMYVPEPLMILGTAIAGCMGYLMKRKLASAGDR